MALTRSNETTQTRTTAAHYGDGYSAQGNPWTQVNVGNVERSLSALGGAALVIYSLIRRGRLSPGVALLAGEALCRSMMGHSFLYQALGINTFERDPTISKIPGKRGIRVRRAMTINRSAQDLFAFWSDVEKAPMYMPSIETVRKTGERTSHWIAKDPLGNTVEWDTEVLQVSPPTLIAWQVHGIPTTASAGKITFEPATNGRGTVVTLELDFLEGASLAGNRIGQMSALLAEAQTRETLRRFKELMETGELPTISGQPVGEGQPLSLEGRKL